VEQKAEEAKKTEEAHLKVEREAQEACEAMEKCQAEEASKAKRVRLEARKRLDRELIEYKERTEAEERKKAKEREKVKAGNGMMLVTPADLLALETARQVNAENARLREEGHKPRAGSSKATPMLKSKPKVPVNLAHQVRDEERAKRTEHKGKNGDAVVSS
jgi:dTMP kinase